MFTGKSKADTLVRNCRQQAPKEQLKIMIKQLVMKFMLQLRKLPKCPQRKQCT